MPEKNTKPENTHSKTDQTFSGDNPEFDASSFLASCSTRAGVYQMYDANNQHLYIGKAKNLKKRLASYFQKDGSSQYNVSAKTAAMVSKIAHVAVTITNSETEALILERNLIRKIRPPYNVTFKDGKSYPYIFLSDHKYPRLSFYRGSKNLKGKYFGPFPNSYAVRESLSLLQKIFKVRQCEDSFYNNRSRPCLQYQIGRCTAPCTGEITPEQYQETVRQSMMFLEGKNDDLTKELQKAMTQAAESLDYETAAEKRDQIHFLQHIQEKQFVEGNRGDTDILASVIQAGQACIQVLYVRQGRVLGSQSHFPKTGLAETNSELLEAFISHHYISGSGSLGNMPNEIIVSESLENTQELAQALSQQANKKIRISHSVKAGRAKWLAMAAETAQQNLISKLHNREQINQRFLALQDELELENKPARIECFDISHSSGEKTVASCVVFDEQGAKKSDYRKFNIDGITEGDDYAAMRQALKRRFSKSRSSENKLPDILLVDGGKGQMTQAQEVFDELGIVDILLIGVAKGEGRKPGLETLFVGSQDNVLNLPSDSPALHLIQQIRDEAHRFAITGHRARREKARRTSPLEGIAGVGPKRRQQLLKHFGGWQEVQNASLEELTKVQGISQKIAEDIFSALHENS